MYRLVVTWLVAGCWNTPTAKEPAPAQPKQLVQPVAIEKHEVDGDPCGVEGGEEGGVVGGMIGAPPPPPPPPPAPPQNVPPTLLEMNRISGDKDIVPNDATKVAILQSGKDKVVGSWKLCIDDHGMVTQVAQLKGTGFPDYDTKIQQGMRLWRYRPFVVNSRPMAVCTAVTIIYSQAAPSPP